MADGEAVFRDRGEKLNFCLQYFVESDDDDEFEGFGPDDLFDNAELITEIDFEQSARDRECQEDVELGWSREDATPLVAPFTGNPGLQSDLPDNPEAIDFFNLLFEDQMWEILTTETNRYAQSKISEEDLKQFSRLKKWEPVTKDEMKVFLSLVIAMGLTRKPDLESYWSVDPIIATPFFGDRMSKDRFMAILSNLHLVDNSQPHDSRLYKVGPMISMMSRTFDMYYPEEALSFDEGTCPFKGRVRFRVYNPNKPHKFGIKLYQVCEASSGYCIGFDIYSGEEGCTVYSEAVDIDPESSQTTKIVVGLLAYCGLLGKGHKVYLDNYYTSPELYSALQYLETYACGTLRVNRKLVPKAFKQVKLKKGEGIYRRMGNLLALKFKDERCPYVVNFPRSKARTNK